MRGSDGHAHEGCRRHATTPLKTWKRGGGSGWTAVEKEARKGACLHHVLEDYELGGGLRLLGEEPEQQRVRALCKAGRVARLLSRGRRRPLDGQRRLNKLEQLPEQQRPQVGCGDGSREGRQRLEQIVHR